MSLALFIYVKQNIVTSIPDYFAIKLLLHYLFLLWLKRNLQHDGKLDSGMIVNTKTQMSDVYTYQCSYIQNILPDNLQNGQKMININFKKNCKRSAKNNGMYKNFFT